MQSRLLRLISSTLQYETPAQLAYNTCAAASVEWDVARRGIAATVRRLSADVVCFQEISHQRARPARRRSAQRAFCIWLSRLFLVSAQSAHRLGHYGIDRPSRHKSAATAAKCANNGAAAASAWMCRASSAARRFLHPLGLDGEGATQAGGSILDSADQRGA